MRLGGLIGLDVEFGERSCVGRGVVERTILLIDGHVRGEGVVSWVPEGISRRRRHPGCLDLRGGKIDIGCDPVC
jgi:hypothetical protein